MNVLRENKIIHIRSLLVRHWLPTPAKSVRFVPGVLKKENMKSEKTRWRRHLFL